MEQGNPLISDFIFFKHTSAGRHPTLCPLFSAHYPNHQAINQLKESSFYLLFSPLSSHKSRTFSINFVAKGKYKREGIEGKNTLFKMKDVYDP